MVLEVNQTMDYYSPKTLVTINFYIVGVGGLIMFFVGTITNILNLVILTRKSLKTTTNKYLAALAICDIFVLIFSTLITSNSFINDYETIQPKSNNDISMSSIDGDGSESIFFSKCFCL